jgi:hypothetical protein
MKFGYKDEMVEIPASIVRLVTAAAKEAEKDRIQSMLNPDLIAEWIRKADGSNTMGAGALGEEICNRLHILIELGE